ncbi:hypothetical protein NIES593_10540 [Hydrococcus rivularis NIES-593]|uniref:Uncharacterized protein n=1 Tax=Hydrococcus rivularis NIES-593 TaxID=1921803 RepID=A0A1U7HI45_9CYAN|nr:hypothetical protein [Hydrococcus rivularis]OKH23266.1 hypothetical protein NIES593_10540 [Hydrococcus rivularis NIES-593]
MLDFISVLNFSHHHCIAICAFLVPANLLITLQTLAMVLLTRPQSHIRWSVAIAACLASILVLHVGTWFAIGVVTPVTFILLGLASTCLTLNLWTANYPSTFQRLLRMAPSILT